MLGMDGVERDGLSPDACFRDYADFPDPHPPTPPRSFTGAAG
jgi:hypothetical protein